MKQKLEQRLQVLKIEFNSGQKMLADLEAKQANIRNTLLRINGAIQVLEELLNDQQQREFNSEISENPETQISAVR